jgi:hypothetical protein
MKIFARAILRGSIVNIFNFIKKVTFHEYGYETDSGYLLKVLKFKRNLIIGGLTAQHDVGGIDAVNVTL